MTDKIDNMKLKEKAEQIKAELAMLKRKTEILDAKPAKKQPTKKSKPAPDTKKPKPVPKKTAAPDAPKKPAPSKKQKDAEPKKDAEPQQKKPAPKKPAPSKKQKDAEPKKDAEPQQKKPAPKKPAPSKKQKDAEPQQKKPNTLEEELEAQLSDEEIENFQIERVDMEKLTNKVCDVLAAKETGSMLQSDLWKKLKLTSRDGSRLALKLERMGTITREKLLENGRWTYRIILKKSPISTWSIEDAPCLVCPVEQRCSLEGETSPRSCQLIEDWVIAGMKRPKKPK